MLKLYICYVIFFLVKRSDYIKKFINWRLLNDGIIVIDNKNIECEYEVNKFIKYKENDNTINYIDLEKQLYIRDNNEFMFKIDFINKVFNYNLKSENVMLEDSIKCQFKISNNVVEMKYNLDDEEKSIIIQIL